MSVSIEEIKAKLLNLAAQHHAIEDDFDNLDEAELVEEEAEQLIVEYCEVKQLLINGFPTEKKALPEGELEDDYFCSERFKLYLDTLATQNDEVSELMWCYVSNFWPDFYKSKEEYLKELKTNIETGEMYDIKL
jgi:hypothetical protein